MRKPTAVVDLDITQPLTAATDLDRFADAEVLCRLRERPLGFVRAPVVSGRIALDHAVRQLLETLTGGCGVALAERAIAAGRPPRWPDATALIDSATAPIKTGPLVTVAVCTRDRTSDLTPCLEALTKLEYDAVDVLVVDNAPASEATERLIRERYRTVRYVREPRPGLDWARNRAVLECRGAILAFTDEDTIVDRYWVSALVRVFLADPEVMAVTGLVIPHELETGAQRLFEAYGGLGRGFTRHWYRARGSGPSFDTHGGTGKFGSGVNMAFWRPVFDDVGGFDPALDAGTPTSGGGDLDMFFRVLKAGHTLVYEPSAIVRHRHPLTAFADERRALFQRLRVPLGVLAAEGIGSIAGLFRYRRSRRRADEIAARFSGEPTLDVRPTIRAPRQLLSEAQRQIDLAEPLRPIADATDYERLRVVVAWQGTLIGVVRIEHHGAVVSAAWLGDEIAQQLTEQVLDARTQFGEKAVRAAVTAGLAQALVPAVEKFRRAAHAVAPDADASRTGVVATYDRPDSRAA